MVPSHESLLPRSQYLNRVCDVHWPAERTRAREKLEVVERWPGSPKGWDLARVSAPVVVSREKPAREKTIQALEILAPPQAAEYVLTGEKNGDRIRLQSTLDESEPVHWYLDDRYIGTSRPDKFVQLDLRPGRHKLVCMSENGATRRVSFRVVRPAESLSFQTR